jgi:hypothetical protein
VRTRLAHLEAIHPPNEEWRQLQDDVVLGGHQLLAALDESHAAAHSVDLDADTRQRWIVLVDRLRTDEAAGIAGSITPLALTVFACANLLIALGTSQLLTRGAAAPMDGVVVAAVPFALSVVAFACLVRRAG